MRLAEHLTLRFARAFDASKQRLFLLVGENPTFSIPALLGCEGLWSYMTTAMHDIEYPLPLPHTPKPTPSSFFNHFVRATTAVSFWVIFLVADGGLCNC